MLGGFPIRGKAPRSPREERMMAQTTTYTRETEEILRALSMGDPAGIESLLKMQVQNIAESGLDPRAHALARLGALIALDAAPASFAWQIGIALDSGVTAEEIVGVMIAVAPSVGMAKIVATAPEIALSLGISMDELEKGGGR
jgi:4-carboxymuconolactone decarboxylase